MTVDPNILLPLLLAAIIANTVIMGAVVIAGRTRSRRLATAGPRMSATDQALANSYVERSARMVPRPDPDPVTPDTVTAIEAAAAAQSEVVAPPVAPEPPAAPAIEPAAVVAASTAVVDGIDPDTGLPDGAAFHRAVVQEDGRLRRYHRPATVVIFELDGPRATRRDASATGPPTASSPRWPTRSAASPGAPTTSPASVGGRFAVLLPETDEIAAINYVERVRRACELWLESGAIALRLAIGWAGTSGDPSLPDTQQVATDRMYAELRRGARRRGDASPASAPVAVPNDEPGDRLAS